MNKSDSLSTSACPTPLKCSWREAGMSPELSRHVRLICKAERVGKFRQFRVWLCYVANGTPKPIYGQEALRRETGCRCREAMHRAGGLRVIGCKPSHRVCTRALNEHALRDHPRRKFIAQSIQGIDDRSDR